MLIHQPLGIYLVRLPLPFKLNHINSYAIKGDDGWWLIDTGLNTNETKNVWKQFMADYQIIGADIKGIYLTHTHPDHFGAAGWLQELSGAPVFISEADAGEMNRVWRSSVQEVIISVSEQLKRNGMPLDFIAKAIESVPELRSLTKPHPVLSIIKPGEMLQFGNFQYRAVFTPGHSDGHMCFFNEEYGVLFTGDHMLSRITSNISLWPFGQVDPLKNYLDSLDIIRSLPCQRAIPAHGSSFENISLRINELDAHHHQRLQLMKECLSGSATAFEVCMQVFGQDLDNHDLRFAVTETLAHLMYLVYKGELKLEERKGIDYFCQVPPATV